MAPRGAVGRRLCRVLVIGFAILWALAAAIPAIGTFGLFGQERDPLSAVYLVPLGFPWVLLPIGSWFWALMSPGLNFAILVAACRSRTAR